MRTRTPRFSPDEFVPSGYRTRRLDEPLRKEIARHASRLADPLRAPDDPGIPEYNDVERDVLSDSPYGWWASGSERSVASLGATYRGDWILEDQSDVVIKYTPWLGVSREGGEEHQPAGYRPPKDPSSGTTQPDSEKYTSPTASGNLFAIGLQKLVDEVGPREHFQPLLDYADDGRWIAMREVTPVFDTSPYPPEVGDDYLWTAQLDHSPISTLLDRIGDTGWDVHTSNGSIGIRADGTPVVIDLGTHQSHASIPNGPAFGAYLRDEISLEQMRQFDQEDLPPFDF